MYSPCTECALNNCEQTINTAQIRMMALRTDFIYVGVCAMVTLSFVEL